MPGSKGHLLKTAFLELPAQRVGSSTRDCRAALPSNCYCSYSLRGDLGTEFYRFHLLPESYEHSSSLQEEMFQLRGNSCTTPFTHTPIHLPMNLLIHLPFILALVFTPIYSHISFSVCLCTHHPFTQPFFITCLFLCPSLHLFLTLPSIYLLTHRYNIYIL